MAVETNVSAIPHIPDFPMLFDFEKDFDMDGAREWLTRSCHHSLYYCAVYFTAIYLGQAFMKNKRALDLKWLLVIWNSSLAMMSLLGACRTVSELFYTLTHFGFEFTICNLHYANLNPVMVCSLYIFCISKVAELFDTMFIILRKQKLIFLHWFHHSSVLVFTWYTTNDLTAMGRWFVAMNYTVHTFMYTYFALRSMKVKVPRSIAMCVTTLQIIQMLVGFYINIRGFEMWLMGRDCEISGRVALLGMSLYTFYFVLFVKFFYNIYILPMFSKVYKSE